MLAIAIRLAKTLGEAYADVAELGDKHPEILGRYLNLVRVPTGDKDEQGVPKIKLLGSNGMKFKVRGNTYAVQQEIESGNESLTKAGSV